MYLRTGQLLVLALLQGCVVPQGPYQPYQPYSPPPAGPTYVTPPPSGPTYVTPPPSGPTYVTPPPVPPAVIVPGPPHPGHGHGYPRFSPASPRVGGGSLSIAHWDVGGGQWIRPWARIEVDVRGPASKIGLYAVAGTGEHEELELRDASNGQRIRFDQRYGRLGTDTLALILYDSRGRIIDVLRRSPTR